MECLFGEKGLRAELNIHLGSFQESPEPEESCSCSLAGGEGEQAPTTMNPHTCPCPISATDKQISIPGHNNLSSTPRVISSLRG